MAGDWTNDTVKSGPKQPRPRARDFRLRRPMTSGANVAEFPSVGHIKNLPPQLSGASAGARLPTRWASGGESWRLIIDPQLKTMGLFRLLTLEAKVQQETKDPKVEEAAPNDSSCRSHGPHTCTAGAQFAGFGAFAAIGAHFYRSSNQSRIGCTFKGSLPGFQRWQLAGHLGR